MANLKYDVDAKRYDELKGKVSAPKFQRNFVWRKKARKELITSIKNGLPIGSFLLQDLGNGKFNIIDGRQRFSTLLDYENHRYEYIEDTDITDEKIISLLSNVKSINSMFTNYTESARKSIVSDVKKIALKQLRTPNATQSDVVYEIQETIKDRFPGISRDDGKALAKEVDAFYKSIWQILDTSNIELPCIIFKTDVNDDEIVSTFVNLNTKGTKLSKYDLYSASWQNDIIMVDDDEIIDKVISKYKDSLDNNQNIETVDFNETEIRNSKEINVFEYAYALSKLIGEKCQNKMYQTKDASEVDSLGFSILASILNVPTKKMVILSKKIISSKINYVDLKNKIIECALKVQNQLEWYCTTPDKKLVYDHSFNQLVSYIVTVFKACYEITVDGRIVDNTNKNKVKDFLSNLPMWYLYDNIRGFWLGSGDTKLDNLVINNDIFSSRYFGKVSEDSFRNTMFEWLEEENSDKNTSVKNETKLFINYILKKRCSEPHNSMDFEHIIPQARLDMLMTRDKNVAGVSSPSNLTMIPSFDNRSKREKTYYELIDSKDETAMSYDKELLDKYLYPERADIRFVEAQSDFTVENYNRFKKDRTNQLINLFFDELYYKK